MTSLKKVFLVGLVLVVTAVGTIRFGYTTMLAMLIGTILLIFYYNERNKRWERGETLTPAEQRVIDESLRGRVKKKPWENVD